jgi:hypothetical protein
MHVDVGCLAWLTLMGKKHLAPYLTEHNGHLGWKIYEETCDKN